MEPRLDTFPRLLLHHAAVRGDHPAVREKDLGIWQTWTWREAAERVVATIREVTKLRGEFCRRAAGDLPNDGKVIDDVRRYD